MFIRILSDFIGPNILFNVLLSTCIIYILFSIVLMKTCIFKSFQSKETSYSLNEGLIPEVKVILHKLRCMSKHYGVPESMMKMQKFPLLFNF